MGQPAQYEIPCFLKSCSTQTTQYLKHLPEIILFENGDFNLNTEGEEEGDSWRTSFDYRYVGDDWRDAISSMLILSGVWEFYECPDYHYENWKPVRLGPGYYPNLPHVGIPNNQINSFRVLSLEYSDLFRENSQSR